MSNYYKIEELKRDGFDIVVDWTDDDTDPEYCFDTSIDPDTGKPYFDVDRIRRQISSGELVWFVLRVRAFLNGHEFGSSYIGGCLYEYSKIKDVLTDGVAEASIELALDEAREQVVELREKLNSLDF